MKKIMFLNKLKTSIKIDISSKFTNIFFDKFIFENKVIYFEFIEKSSIHNFYLSIKVHNSNVNLEKKALIDLDGQLLYGKYFTANEECDSSSLLNTLNDDLVLTIDNLFFNGDICDDNLFVNLYVFDDVENNIIQLDSIIEKNMSLVSIQDYYFN